MLLKSAASYISGLHRAGNRAVVRRESSRSVTVAINQAYGATVGLFHVGYSARGARVLSGRNAFF